MTTTKTGILALALGLAITLITFLAIVLISNDMRWILLIGAVGLFGGALWTGSKRGGGPVSLVLLCLPLMVVYGVLVVPELPGLWPHLAVWLAIAVLGWHGFRSGQRRKMITPVAAILIAVVSFWYGTAYVPDQIAQSLNQFRNDPAPPLALYQLDGSPYPMESLAGKVLLLDFFATWCAPCIAELPELAAIRRHFKTRNDVEILVVANDSGDDTPASIQTFVAESDLDLPFAYDPDGAAHAAFGFSGLPALVVIDRTGRIRLSREGYNAAETDFRAHLESFIESL